MKNSKLKQTTQSILDLAGLWKNANLLKKYKKAINLD